MRKISIFLTVGLIAAQCVSAAAFEGYGGNHFLSSDAWCFASVSGKTVAIPEEDGDVLVISNDKEGMDFWLEGDLLTCLNLGEEYDFVYSFDLKERHREVLLSLNKGSAFLGRDQEKIYYIEADEEMPEKGVLGSMDCETLEVTEYTEGVYAALYDGKDLYALIQNQPEKITTEDEEDGEKDAADEEKEVLSDEVRLIRVDPVKGTLRTLKRDCGKNLMKTKDGLYFDLSDGKLCVLEEGKVRETRIRASGSQFLYEESGQLYLRKADGDFACADPVEEELSTWETPSGTTPERILDQGRTFWYVDDILFDADFGVLWKAGEGEVLLGMCNGKKVIQAADGTVRKE